MIYLLRHGLDDENYIGGWSDVDLVEEGIKQIERSRNFISKNLSIKRIISSDIKRTQTTARIVNKNLNLPIELDSRLRELDKGNLTGLLKENLDINTKNFIRNITINDKYPNGESMISFYKRIKKLLPKLKEYDDTLLITHRGVINMIYYYLENIELDMNKERFKVTHGSIHELDLDRKLIRRIY